MAYGLYDVTKTLRRHYFLGNANHNKSIRPFLHLNALYPLAFVPSQKDASCPSNHFVVKGLPFKNLPKHGVSKGR